MPHRSPQPSSHSSRLEPPPRGSQTPCLFPPAGHHRPPRGTPAHFLADGPGCRSQGTPPRFPSPTHQSGHLVPLPSPSPRRRSHGHGAARPSLQKCGRRTRDLPRAPREKPWYPRSLTILTHRRWANLGRNSVTRGVALSNRGLLSICLPTCPPT